MIGDSSFDTEVVGSPTDCCSLFLWTDPTSKFGLNLSTHGDPLNEEVRREVKSTEIDPTGGISDSEE